MTVTHEARYLSGTDLGKTITYQVGESHIQGMLYDLNHTANLIEETTYADLAAGRERWAIGQQALTVSVLADGEAIHNRITMNTLVTITGTDIPPGLKPHRGVLDQEE